MNQNIPASTRWHIAVLSIVFAGFLLACSVFSVPARPAVAPSAGPAATTEGPEALQNRITLKSLLSDVLHRHVGENWSPVAEQSTTDVMVGDGVTVDDRGHALLTFGSNVTLEVFRNSELQRLDNWVRDAPVLKVRQGFLHRNSGVAGNLLKLVDDYYEITDIETDYWLYHDSAAGSTWIVVTQGRVRIAPLNSPADAIEVPAGFQALGVKGARPVGPLPATRPLADVVGQLSVASLPPVETLTNGQIADVDLLGQQPGCSPVQLPLELHAQADGKSPIVVTLLSNEPLDVVSRASAGDANWVWTVVFRTVDGKLQTQAGWALETSVKCSYEVALLPASEQPAQEATRVPEVKAAVEAVRVTPNTGDETYGYSNVCPQEFQFSSTIVASGPGAVKYWWQRVRDAFQTGSGVAEFNLAARAEVRTVWSPPPGTKEEWEFVVLSPDGTVDRRRFVVALECPSPMPAPAVVAVKTYVRPSEANACPATLVFGVDISVKGATPVEYEWVDETGNTYAQKSVYVGAGGFLALPDDLSLTWSDSFKGALRVHVVKPNEWLSDWTYFVVSCPAPTAKPVRPTSPPQQALLEAPLFYTKNVWPTLREAERESAVCQRAERQFVVGWEAPDGATGYKVQLELSRDGVTAWTAAMQPLLLAAKEVDLSKYLRCSYMHRVRVSAQDARGRYGKEAQAYFKVDSRLD